MAKAIWNGTVIAESDNTVVVDGNHYFPPDGIKTGILRRQRHANPLRMER